MEKPSKPTQGQTSLFQIYLRLRPQINQHAGSQPPKSDTYLTVEPANAEDPNGTEKWPTRITVQPPNDSRKRAVEKFAFTKVFEEQTNQLDVFEETEMVPLIKGVLAEGRDGLVATLGVSGSGKTHTMLGSKTQRGMTQMSLEVLFRSLSTTVRTPDSPTNPVSIHTLAASDPSEAHIFSAKSFLESTYGDPPGRGSRAQTPLTSSRGQTPMVWNPNSPQHPSSVGLYPEFPSPGNEDQSQLHTPSARPFNADFPGITVPRSQRTSPRKPILPYRSPFWNSHRTTKLIAKPFEPLKDTSGLSNYPRRPFLQRPSALPQLPDVGNHMISVSPDDEYAVLVSMYEVHNDRIFDLLAPAIGATGTRQAANTQKDRRRPLLFKPTEGSADRKVVAGLRKIVCGTYEEALLVLEAGLTERRVAGTGSNSVSSRSHGFFCVEVKKRAQNQRYYEEYWAGNTLTIVDLAGSERVRNAKTAGATLTEAGKINESLMYLGQCLQMQGDLQEGNKALVPFRQCKLTELLLANSFPSSNNNAISQHRYPQKALMIVTADPYGDFNATSQILRYSALAREVTVPRIPSVTSTISAAPSQANKGPQSGNKSYLYPASAEELETAALEIARISDDYKVLAIRLAEEEIARAEAEFRARAAEEKCLTVEQDVREECWADMEQRMDDERRRWQTAWDDQTSRHDEHLDKKLDLFSQNFKIYEDPEPPAAEKVEELEQENVMLRNRITALERELFNTSPTNASRYKKNMVSKPTDSAGHSSLIINGESDVENTVDKMGQLKLKPTTLTPSSPVATPKSAAGKKSKRLTSRQRDLGPEEYV